MIELRILGALDLRTADGRTLDEALRRSKRVALLAYLAAARPVGFHRRDKLAALFWPELDKERSRGALRTTLSRLRDDLGDDVIESRGAEEIGVRRDRLWCDVAALYACLNRDDAVGAADLYGGTMLDGVHIPGTSEEFEQWISEERTNIRSSLIGALSVHVERLVASVELTQALALAQRAVVVAPDDEAAARRLIQVALSAGDRGAAFRAYEEIERVLRREYDVSPSAETAALVAPLRGAAVHDKSSAALSRNGVANDETTTNRGALESAGTAFRSGTALPPLAPRASARWPWHMLAIAATAVVIVAVWQFARVGMTRDVVSFPAAGYWRLITSGAGSPHARHHARMAVDSSGDGALILGGASIADGRVRMEPIGSEIWRLIGLRAGAVSQWLRIPVRPGSAPRPRWMFGAAFDQAADRWFVHGGAQGWSSPCANDTWVLDRASGLSGAPAWRAVQLRGPLPPPRAGFELTFDRNRRKLIIFGGNDCVNTYFHDTWTLTFDDSTFTSGAWTRLLPDSTEGQPVTRTAYAATYDTNSARLFVFGGVSQLRSATSELWVLEHADGASGAPRWRALRCAGDPPWLAGSASSYDTARDVWTFFGGSDESSTPRRDFWRLDGLIRNTRTCHWTRVRPTEPWPIARTAASAVTLVGTSGFLLFGGQVEQFSVGDVWIFSDSIRR